MALVEVDRREGIAVTVVDEAPPAPIDLSSMISALVAVGMMSAISGIITSQK
ncbi:hypothetical protein KKF61_08705 [Patescibacteria group bacterium]|nr:hypothetical protein [Patescibacteria group bacterium]